MLNKKHKAHKWETDSLETDGILSKTKQIESLEANLLHFVYTFFQIEMFKESMYWQKMRLTS